MLFRSQLVKNIRKQDATIPLTLTDNMAEVRFVVLIHAVGGNQG
ncbi:hypothetical protein EC026C_50100 [Escherichia coli]